MKTLSNIVKFEYELTFDKDNFITFIDQVSFDQFGIFIPKNVSTTILFDKLDFKYKIRINDENSKFIKFI